MAISDYLKDLRDKIGHSLLLLPAVAAVIKDDSGHTLFQRRSDDRTWSMPAGSIEPGETPAQAIVREVFEETGLTVTAERVIGVFGGPDFTWTYANGDCVQYTVIVFRCRIEGGKLEPQDDESMELRFFPCDQRPQLELNYPNELFTGEPVHTIFQ